MTGLRTDAGRPAVVSGGFADLSSRASSCLEELNITAPRAVIDVHRRHILDGANILRTNTAGASPERLDRYRMHDEAFIVSYMAAEHASKAAKIHGTGQRVMGVACVEAHAPLIGFLPLERVTAAARTMASGLVAGGADLLLVETAQCAARIAAAMDGARLGMADAGRSVPIIVKLRHEVRLAAPSRSQVTVGLASAAAVAAGAGAAAVAIAPANLEASYSATLRTVATSFAGPIFIDLAPTSPHWADVAGADDLHGRIALVAGGVLASPKAADRVSAVANDTGPRRIARRT